MRSKFSIKKAIKTFGYAFNGLREVARNEQNFKIHLAAAVIAIALSFLLNVTDVEFLIVIICIAAVMSMEIINTAIEKLCDHISPGRNEKIKAIKDIAAAAVLIVSICAFIIGVIIFLPKLIASL